MKIISTTLLFLCISIVAIGQVKKTVHQTFELEETTTIQLQIEGEYSIEPWAGNTIMTETKIELYDASPAILKHFVEEKGRYEIESKVSGEHLNLVSVHKNRKAIRYKEIDCFESVKIRIFVPEEFEKEGDNTLKRTL